MTTIHLGVEDAISYRRGPWKGRTESAGLVAAVLEARYGLFQHFVENLKPDLVRVAVEKALQARLDRVFAGQPPLTTAEAFDGAPLEEAFRDAIESEAFDGIVGTVGPVPTGAARRGVSHLLRHPYAKGNPPRPSFDDTGFFKNHVRVWAD